MEKELSEYDIRQFLLIKEKIDSLKDRKISLNEFVIDMIGITHALESVDETFRDSLYDTVSLIRSVIESVQDGCISNWYEEGIICPRQDLVVQT